MNPICQNHLHRFLQSLFTPRLTVLALLLSVAGLLAPERVLAVGTWTPLANLAPDSVGLMLLLSDGTVMCQQYSDTNWYRLTPDTNGSYVNGTWTTNAPMHDSRLYFASQVLRDGRVLVTGGEYGSGTNGSSEVYQPTNNTWTLTPPIGVAVSDGNSEVLPNGNVMVQPVPDALGTRIFDIVSNTWSVGPTLLADQNEATWVKLPDDSILSIDDASTTSERFIPSLNQWIADATVPVNLYNYKSELGGGYLLPNGKVFFIGATNQTAIYTPSGTTNAGSWVIGPVIPNNFGANDAPSAMMVNGKILCAFGTNTDQVAPTYFYEYDYVSNSFTQVSSPTGGLTDNNPTFVELMLDLPDGTVLYTDSSSQIYVYTPDGSSVTNGKPVINSVTKNADGSYHVTGTLFDGISEGAVYGDDWQMNTDYPIARLTNSAGAVQYCRTFNWSSSSVMTGTNILTTEMTLPAGLTNGTYPLVIAANGISSDAYTLIVSSVNTTPTNIVASVSGTNLTLFWPLDHTGWRLLAQTNNLASGISRNTNDWGTVSGSASTNMIIVPIDRTKKTGFYRLIYP
jgi:hypothetical protein